jgi:hypothetical protein
VTEARFCPVRNSYMASWGVDLPMTEALYRRDPSPATHGSDGPPPASSLDHCSHRELVEKALQCGAVSCVALVPAGPSRRYRSALTGTIVPPTYYYRGIIPMIIQHPIETPIVNSIETQGRLSDPARDTIPCHDLRKVGLGPRRAPQCDPG